MRTIAVTGMNATDNPAPGVAVLRSLRQGVVASTPVRLVGLAYDALDPGIYARDIVDAVFMLPYPSSSPGEFLERLREIRARTELSVIVPTVDAELPTFIELAPALRSLGIATLLPTREQFDARSKARLQAFARRHGFRTPETLVLSGPEDIRRMERLTYPFFIKGPFYGAKLVTNLEDALAAFHGALAEWGGPVIAQACVPGDAKDERNVVGLGDGRGGLVGAVPMKKLAVTDKGKGWAGVTIRDPALLALTERFVRATHWSGPFELEVVLGRDGVYYVIEINPRFPAWVYLATSAGMNLPQAAVALALGEEPRLGAEYALGTMFVRISIDQIATMADLERVIVTGESVNY